MSQVLQSPYQDKISNAIALANKKFCELLEVEKVYYQGDMALDKVYGFTMPRKFDPLDQEVRGGYQKHTVELDVLCEFAIPVTENIQKASMAKMLEVNHVISQINQYFERGMSVGNMRPGELEAVQTQLTTPPHDFKITIVGTAFLDCYIYRDSYGVPAIKG